ncbi:RNA-binding protein 5-B-like [Anopheles darlingi]|uniref:RNA-binding protein 5-B-like n=1 Tax=Anopheles darlingi TaxID=43151 RepID=UPI0021004586|nr:RNA-binding protein 5-B-like [Anopheles darlingi]
MQRDQQKNAAMMDFSPSPDSETSGYYRNRSRRDERDRGNRGRSKDRFRNNSRYSRSRSRSYSRERYTSRQRSDERDPYRDEHDQEYDDGGWERERYRPRSRERDRDRDRERRSRERYRDRRVRDKEGRRGGYSPSSMDDIDNFDSENEYMYDRTPNNNIIIRGLAPQVTEADIVSDLIQCGLQALSVRLIRRKKTGESRGFAFVEFRTEEEATRWICNKQGVLVFNGYHAVMQYTFSMPSKMSTDWFCSKCYAFNFKRRENCFKCHASRKGSEIGGDGSDEMSNILTKKIMLRNLDVLTNEESVLGVMQKRLSAELVGKISKVVICRDPLTSISHGMCYLHFENLVDSMNTHNALKELEPPLVIDNREVIVSYCMDTENRNVMKPNQPANHPHHHHHQRAEGGGGNLRNGGGDGRGQQSGDHSQSGSYHHHHHHHHGGGHRGDGAGPSFDRYGNSHGSNKNSGGSSGNSGGGGRNSYHQGGTAAQHQNTTAGGLASTQAASTELEFPGNYTLADVPRLAEYSASMYASNTAEHAHYLQYYTDYYNSKLAHTAPTVTVPPAVLAGAGSGIAPRMSETANNGAAVAQSAIARKQAGGVSGNPNIRGAKDDRFAPVVASTVTNQPQPQLPVPNGLDGRKYPVPDTSLYQFDETSGFYYDPTTGLYYDANSQYHYNRETGSYLYWDSENQTYVAVPPSTGTEMASAQHETTASTLIGPTLPAAFEPDSAHAHVPLASAVNDGTDKAAEKSKTKDHQAPPQDKVKVAKKIVKDMEKWAKQLNQKKDYSVLQPPARIEEATLYSSLGPSSRPLAMESQGGASAGYADVGFSLLEKKERLGGGSGNGGSDGYTATGKPTQGGNIPSGSQYGGGSDSDHEYGDDAGSGARERDLVDFEALTCLLCKRAFQSQEILAKHLKMSALHKENLKKLNRGGAGGGGAGGGSSDGGSGGPSSLQQYRDRAKERRAKYGEDDAPPVNRSKERFQRELEKQTTSSYQQSASVSAPISQNNVGNKLLQKMGWSEGQGLGKSNQGRVNIIEAEARVANVGLGIKANSAAQFSRTTDDYKTYIKKMMKSRYEQVEGKD